MSKPSFLGKFLREDEFLVWTEDHSGPEEAELFIAGRYPQYVAKTYIEKNHGRFDYPEEFTVYVRDHLGVTTEWIVTAEPTIKFTATGPQPPVPVQDSREE